MINFDGVKLNNKDPVYMQICLHVKQQILLGRAKMGDKFPSRREIAAKLNINPNTVQKAFALMEEEGYVITDRNRGSKIHLNDRILSEIKHELTYEVADEFISYAKTIDLSFKQVIDLLSELWDEQ